MHTRRVSQQRTLESGTAEPIVAEASVEVAVVPRLRRLRRQGEAEEGGEGIRREVSIGYLLDNQLYQGYTLLFHYLCIRAEAAMPCNSLEDGDDER